MKSIYLTVIFIVTLTACSPEATATPTTVAAVNTETLPAPPTPTISAPSLSPTATREIFPTFTPAPTSTALPTLRPGQPLRLASLHMSDEQNGWGIDTGEHLVHTSDGGQTWKDVTPRNGAYRSSGFFALDANTAWATPYQQACYTDKCAPSPNNASVWHTTDGGSTWQEQHICLQAQECNFDFAVPPSYYFPISIDFLGEQTGWLLVTVEHVMFQDRYILFQTSDAGAHWLPIVDSFSGPMTMSVTGLAFQDRQMGWLSTSEIDGATDPIADWSIYQSQDAGHTWNEIQLPAPNPLPKPFTQNQTWCGAYGVTAIPPDALGVTIKCRVYTDPLSEYEFYFHSADGGKNWISWLKTGDVDFINPQTGWRSTLDNGVYDLEQTRDGGKTWTKLKTVNWNGSLDFVNEQTGWAIATSDNLTALVHTTDGGQTWKEIQPVIEK